MRAFVTGASGFIGSRLVESLLEQGWSIRALVHESPLRRPGKIESVLGDIRDPDPWKDTLRGTDVLFHLAAALGFSRLSKDGFFEVNARGTEALFRAARNTGVRRIVHCQLRRGHRVGQKRSCGCRGLSAESAEHL